MTLFILQMELATGVFPYAAWSTPFDQLAQVVKGDPPRLPPGQFSPELEDFVTQWYVSLALPSSNLFVERLLNFSVYLAFLAK